MDLIHDEMQLMYETEIAFEEYENQFSFFESSSGDNPIKKIANSIKEFLQKLMKSIIAFCNENSVRMNLNKIIKMTDKVPELSALTVDTFDLTAYAAGYKKYISTLRSLNVELDNTSIENSAGYFQKIKSAEDEFAKVRTKVCAEQRNPGEKIKSMINKKRVQDAIQDGLTMLDEIKNDGIKSIPDPKNIYIAKAFAKASAECGKMAGVAQRQMTRALTNVKFKKYEDMMFNAFNLKY